MDEFHKVMSCEEHQVYPRKLSWNGHFRCFSLSDSSSRSTLASRSSSVDMPLSR